MLDVTSANDGLSPSTPHCVSAAGFVQECSTLGLVGRPRDMAEGESNSSAFAATPCASMAMANFSVASERDFSIRRCSTSRLPSSNSQETRSV